MNNIEEAALNWLADGDFFQANVAARAKLTRLRFSVVPERRCGFLFKSRLFADGPQGGCYYRYLGRHMMPTDAQRACEAHYSNIVVEAPRRPRGSRARHEEAWTLIEFLASRGGLDPDDRLIGDVRAAIGSNNKFIPGFGQLIRNNGMRLDRAREAAVEAGYLCAHAQTFVTDLINAVDRELRGAPLYRYDRIPDHVTRAEIERMQDEEERR
jgi:hypothetical protein